MIGMPIAPNATGAVFAIRHRPAAYSGLKPRPTSSAAVMATGAPKPAAVIGLPVGFVGAAESKEALAADRRVPHLIVRGRKGGSAMAVAAVNALASEHE